MTQEKPEKKLSPMLEAYMADMQKRGLEGKEAIPIMEWVSRIHTGNKMFRQMVGQIFGSPNHRR